MTPTVTHPASSGCTARRRWRRVAVAAAILLFTTGVAATVALGADPGGGRYRTATTAIQDITETMDEVGTIEPVSQVAVAFPTAGTVSTVEVELGDSVEVGTVLATLDTQALEADVRAGQNAVDQAQLTLERALNGESVAGNTGTGAAGVVGLSPANAVTATLTTQTEPRTETAPAPEQNGGGSTSDDPELTAAQQAVLDAQRTVDAVLRDAAERLASAQQICAALGQDTDDNPPPSTTTTTPSSTTTTTTTMNTGDDGEAASACYDALASVLDAQQTAQTAQNTLVDAAAALDALLAERAATTRTTTTPAGGGPAPAGSAGLGATPSGDDSAPSVSTPTATPSSEDLIAYQKAVDEAELKLVVAEHALEHQGIVSPIQGTVVAVDIEPGEGVDAASDTATIVVAGDGGYEVTATVSVDDLPDLEVGQTVTVVPDGSTEQLNGELVAIGLVAPSGTTGTTYQVTVALESESAEVRNGSIASMAIAIDETTQALAVPTSAVKVDGGGHYVLVLDAGTPERTSVKIGAIGGTWTEITDGLDDGEVVVIADLEEPLPGSATDTGEGGEGAGVGGGPARGGFGGGPRGLPAN